MPVEEEESDGEDAVGKKKLKPKGIPLPCAAAAGLTPAQGGSIDNPSEVFKT